MSSRTRMMGAGNASATKYNTNVNLNTGGGNKKQGITSRVGLDNWANSAVQTYSNGYGRNKLFTMNQLGGVGAGHSMFNGRFTQVDGVRTENPSYYVEKTIEEKINRLKSLLRMDPRYVNPSDPYKLSLIGEKENFRQDLIDAGLADIANEAHAKIIRLNADDFKHTEMKALITELNGLSTKQIPTTAEGHYFGPHILCVIPKSTGYTLNNVRYGLKKWYGLQVYLPSQTQWVAVGSNNNGSCDSIIYSQDGINWTGVSNSNAIFPGGATAVAYGPLLGGLSFNAPTWCSSMWVAVGSNYEFYGNSIAYSYDGINWSAGTTYYQMNPSNGNAWEQVADPGMSFGYTNSLIWTGEYFIAAGSNGNVLFVTSVDGINWYINPDSNGLYPGPITLVFNSNNQVLATDANFMSVALTYKGSFNLTETQMNLTWTPPLDKETIMETGNVTFYTSNINWTENAALLSTSFYNNVYSPNYYATDSTATFNLVTPTMPFPDRPGVSSIAYNDSVIVAAGGNLAYSTDKGQTWTQSNQYARNVAYNGSTFVGVGSIDGIIYSENGISWSVANYKYPFSVLLNAIASNVVTIPSNDNIASIYGEFSF